MANINDVARLAGVSKATVSRVLNGVSVREDSKKRVLAAINALDFLPNAQARSLTSGRTNVVGVLVPSIEGPFYGPILESCQQTLLSFGLNMMVCSTYHRQGSEWAFATMLREKRVDGLLIITPREIALKPMQDLIGEMTEEGFPIVVVDGETDCPYIPGVWVDNKQGGYLGAQHLLTLGHHRIGLLLGPPETVETKHQFAGFRDALNEFGQEYDDELTFYVQNYSLSEGFRAGRRIVPKMPSAVFAASDALAAGFMRYCAEKMINVPEQISVLGFDDTLYAELTGLTTIKQPLKLLGAEGARMLIQLVRGEVGKGLVVLPVELVLRGTTRSTRQD